MAWHRLALVLGLAAALSGASVAGEQWRLSWSDGFERDTVGDGWVVTHGQASVREGKLHLEGGGACIITSKAFAPDVRLEFDAVADPRFPPCDLSAALAANEIHGYSYLLAFGGQNNRVNQILGPGVRKVVEKPALLIQPGRTYHISALKEGRRLALSVDGVTVVEAEAGQAAGGPGLDRVGLVTWAGMIADNVRVYERDEPAPENSGLFAELTGSPFARAGAKLMAAGPAAPGVQKALDALNAGRPDEALKLFGAVGDPALSLWGRAWALGDLSYAEANGSPEFLKLAADARDLLAKRPADESLRRLAAASGWFGDLVMSRSGLSSAIRLTGLGERGNPFYHKARLYEARYLYWNGMEGGNRKAIAQAVEMMAGPRKLWPENTVLRQYGGEAVPWGEELNADVERHPAWAAYLREAYARQARIMETWFQKRQAPDGQLGGGWGDDVELMRTWMQIAAISTGPEQARAGIQKLADGVWKTLKDGYDPGIGDVEHSSEPSADTAPAMLLLCYGDPLYVERNMLSCRTIKERFMGIDANGYPRFISSEFGAGGVNRQPQAGGDTGYHARAMKHLLWQAWWGDEAAKDWFARWTDGWRAKTAAQIGTKPPGLPPMTIWHPSGTIAPPDGGGPWWDPKRNYYGQMGGMVFDSMLAAYALTGERRFLSAFQLMMDSATKGPLPRGPVTPGSPEDFQMQMVSMPDASKTALYRLLTGERVYDEYTRRNGDPAQVYRTDYDIDRYTKSFEAVAKSLRSNLELRTTEVLATDRAALDGALTVFGAYTGAVTGLRDASTPTFAVTYDAPDADFAALVVDSSPERLRVWLYSFHDRPVRIGLRLWRVSPGEYVLKQGRVLPGEAKGQNRYAWQPASRVKVLHRADAVYVDVPPNAVYAVDLRLERPVSVPAAAPDLAIDFRDVRPGRNWQVTLHNIGNAAAGQFAVRLERRSESGWRKVSEQTVKSLPAPANLRPSRLNLSLSAPSAQTGATYRITLDPADRLYEICESNNSCVIRW